jgi:hypothetical protein
VLSAAPDAINNAVGYAKFYSRSQDAVIRVHDEAGDVIETRLGRLGFSFLRNRGNATESGDVAKGNSRARYRNRLALLWELRSAISVERGDK